LLLSSTLARGPVIGVNYTLHTNFSVESVPLIIGYCWRNQIWQLQVSLVAI
jgi:hypothetical protein